VAKLDFYNSQVSTQNLGGMGPDTAKEALLRFENLGTVQAQGQGNEDAAAVTIDLVVRNLTTYTPYGAFPSGVNGYVRRSGSQPLTRGVPSPSQPLLLDACLRRAAVWADQHGHGHLDAL